ncbi:peptidase family C69 [Oleomonas cavernae]|uniref:Dipeptidase n=1 Tax=Oleomonas cavernae TaxID=2320859 RepID=A0A418WDS3_9PROT|nr:C69 family dipeptidase [Oleomonas cavernae]RJF88099.1 peptidase family C69 [Oleomonas cavernae]
MCDTMVVPPAVSGGAMLFAKNSDREGSEAQVIEVHRRRRAAPGAMLHATYLSLPEVYETAAVLICRPYWMWGAEMGVNEHGLAIGNEAVFSRVRPAKDAAPALSGMDLVRLGLERARSAESAVAVITTLVERYGQGADGGHSRPFHYDSAFLIADSRDAFVVETAGQHWAVERVTGARAISNAYSIHGRFERLSGNAKAFAVERGWARADAPFDFARAFADPFRSFAARGRQRACRARGLIDAQAAKGSVHLRDLMGVLRDHGPRGHRAGWRPDGLLPSSICAHGGHGPARRAAQTTMSLVAALDRALSEIWATGGSAPCTALFRPFFIETGLPVAEPAPTDRADGACLWWRQERLHRAVIQDHGSRLALYAPARDALEVALMAEIERARAAAADRPAAERRHLLSQVGQAAWTVAEDALARWTRIAEDGPIARRPGALFRYHWRHLAKRAHTQPM